MVSFRIRTMAFCREVPVGINRLRRRVGLDRNPLRRREDHVQTAVGLLLAFVVLVSAPLGGFVVGSHVFQIVPHTQRALAAVEAVYAGLVAGTLISMPFVLAYARLLRRLDASRYRLWDAGWAWATVKWGLRDNY